MYFYNNEDNMLFKLARGEIINLDNISSVVADKRTNGEIDYKLYYISAVRNYTATYIVEKDFNGIKRLCANANKENKDNKCNFDQPKEEYVYVLFDRKYGNIIDIYRNKEQAEARQKTISTEAEYVVKNRLK